MLCDTWFYRRLEVCLCPLFAHSIEVRRLIDLLGVVLDFDLACKRSLGPLRRFEFVAPAAHPTGFSIGFMMANQGNEFVRDLVNNLAPYNHVWFYLPYVAVMFSTGCHYAS